MVIASLCLTRGLRLGAPICQVICESRVIANRSVKSHTVHTYSSCMYYNHRHTMIKLCDIESILDASA